MSKHRNNHMIFYLLKSQSVSDQSNQELRDIASSYVSDNPYFKPHPSNPVLRGEAMPYYNVDEQLGTALGHHFHHTSDEVDHPQVQASYGALARETIAQFEALKKAGYKFTVNSSTGEPYPNSKAMHNDVKSNKHIAFFPTFGEEEGIGGFGEEGSQSQNPLLAQSGHDINGRPLLVNDVFRAVHDIFGHAKEGTGFGARGEDNAWRVHSQMYSPEAQLALANETRAQNSWVNFGPHIVRKDGTLPVKGDEDWVHPASRPFADQKSVRIPPQFYDNSVVTEAQKP